MNNYLSQATNLANPQVLKLSYLNVVKILFLLLEDWKHRLPFHVFKILSWLVDLNTCVDMNVCMCVKTLVWDLVPMYVCKPGEFPVASSITHSLFIFLTCVRVHVHTCMCVSQVMYGSQRTACGIWGVNSDSKHLCLVSHHTDRG